MVVFGGLLALGKWEFSEYGSVWVSARIWGPKGYSNRGRTTRLFQVKDSSLEEPWSQVSYSNSLQSFLTQGFGAWLSLKEILHEKTS